MRKGIGIACIVLGVLCLLASVSFVLRNRAETEEARNASETLLLEVKKSVEPVAETPKEQIAEEMLPGTPRDMLTAVVDGYDCLGFLSIPVLELELPVLANWDYEKMQVAPCHYYGNCYESDFVIAAHNHDAHFGLLPQLQSGDLILFTDMHGEIHGYEVVLLETLTPTATKEMITSGFDLSLYTCTPGGSNRVTVRCTKVQ